MVFTSIINFVRARGPDEFWRKRKIFKLAAHFRGRRRNVYSIAIRNVHRALQYATKGRKLKKLDMAMLWTQRVNAGCTQYGISYDSFREGLMRSDIMLNRKSMADLAAFEPRSFEVLAKLSRDRAVCDNLPDITNRSALSQVFNLNKKIN